ncbi:hypothetical protein [Variovorax sp. PvP013]|uniref:hypothetical protein n=1 Tax=Variovorax sp. PvP013 TaxID=3156435 RepID=UPI003D2212FB
MMYEGKLKEPIVQQHHGLLSDLNAEQQRINIEMLSKLPALFEAHQVEAGNWMRLAFELAKAHVPGFQVNAPAGRPLKWELAEKAAFRIDVDEIISDAKLSLSEAIKLAIRQPRWAEQAREMTMAALVKQYKTTEMWSVEVLQDARRLEKMGTDK